MRRLLGPLCSKQTLPVPKDHLCLDRRASDTHNWNIICRTSHSSRNNWMTSLDYTGFSRKQVRVCAVNLGQSVVTSCLLSLARVCSAVVATGMMIKQDLVRCLWCCPGVWQCFIPGTMDIVLVALHTTVEIRAYQHNGDL
eukprot:scpid52149/ scgid10983/ 